MTHTIEIEVTPTVKQQYDDLVKEHGEAIVQTDLLQAVVPAIRDGHQQLKTDSNN